MENVNKRMESAFGSPASNTRGRSVSGATNMEVQSERNQAERNQHERQHMNKIHVSENSRHLNLNQSPQETAISEEGYANTVLHNPNNAIEVASVNTNKGSNSPHDAKCKSVEQIVSELESRSPLNTAEGTPTNTPLKSTRSEVKRRVERRHELRNQSDTENDSEVTINMNNHGDGQALTTDVEQSDDRAQQQAQQDWQQQE